MYVVPIAWCGFSNSQVILWLLWDNDPYTCWILLKTVMWIGWIDFNLFHMQFRFLYHKWTSSINSTPTGYFFNNMSSYVGVLYLNACVVTLGVAGWASSLGRWVGGGQTPASLMHPQGLVGCGLPGPHLRRRHPAVPPAPGCPLPGSWMIMVSCSGLPRGICDTDR